MNILVTGSSGYLGGRLCALLEQNSGYIVKRGTRFPRTQDEIKTDWASFAALKKVCDGMDVIVHAAGMNAAACAADPAAALVANGVGTAELVEAAIAAGVARFFYVSTAHVYGCPLQGKIDENTCPRNLHPYASSHLAGEYALLHALVERRIVGSSLRLSNGFGAPLTPVTDCWTLLTNDLCRQAVKQGKLVLQSSGDQRRDFVPLSAVCEDILKLLRLPKTLLPPILNIGNGESMAVIEMARLIQSRCEVILGFSPAIETGLGKEPAMSLHYASLHAESLGLVATDPVAEIDVLLTFCKTHFTA